MAPLRRQQHAQRVEAGKMHTIAQRLRLAARRSRQLTLGIAAIAAAICTLDCLGSEPPAGAAQWTLQGIVLRLPWGDGPGEVGKQIFRFAMSPDTPFTSGPTRVTVDRDGGFCIADAHNARVIYCDAAGKFRWAVGRKGFRPGEFSGTIRKAVVGPSGSIYVIQTAAVESSQETNAAGEAWRTGVICLTAEGHFRFSTHAGSALSEALGADVANLPFVRDFWIDDEGRIYEQLYWDGTVIARFAADGRFERLWRPEPDLGRPLMFGAGEFYTVSWEKGRALPSGRWTHSIYIDRWQRTGERLPRLVVEVTSRTQHWSASLVGVGVTGNVVIRTVDELPEPDGTSFGSKMRLTLLLVDRGGKVIVTQDRAELLRQLPGQQQAPFGQGSVGMFVGGASDLYFNPYSDKDFHLAKFALKPSETVPLRNLSAVWPTDYAWKRERCTPQLQGLD